MQALQASFAGVRVAHKAQERTRRATAVVRAADDGKVTTGATRSKDTLYLGGIGASEQGLTYLDRSLPADYGCVSARRRRGRWRYWAGPCEGECPAPV